MRSGEPRNHQGEHRIALAVAVSAICAILLLSGCASDNSPLQIPEGTPPRETILRAKDLEFEVNTLFLGANVPVRVELINEDEGVLHNLSVYDSEDLGQIVYSGELVAGKATIIAMFETPGPGSYFFRCDVHPSSMSGTLFLR